MKKRSKAIAAVILAALTCIAFPGLAACTAAPSEPVSSGSTEEGAPAALPAADTSGGALAQVTVSASASVWLVPDKATLSFGVNSEAADAGRAIEQNAEAVQQVIDTLTERGVEERSIRTTRYSLYPQYDYSGRGEPRLTGYMVNTQMTVQDQDIDDVGSLISACVAAGVNNIDSVAFLCSGYDEAYSEALAQAVANARIKAEALAQAAGRPLGEVTVITEGWQDTSARYTQNQSFDAAADESEAVLAASLQPGESEISANVTVTFALG